MNVKLVPLWWVIISIIIRGYSLLEIKNASVEAINNAINEGKGLCYFHRKQHLQVVKQSLVD